MNEQLNSVNAVNVLNRKLAFHQNRLFENHDFDYTLSYLYKESHQLRVRIVLRMIEEECERLKKNPLHKGSFKLLSIGCASGIVEEKFIKMGLKVYGTDVCPKALEQAKRRGLIVKNADATKKLPYKDASFDIIYAGEIVEHLLDVRVFFSEVRRVLKPRGLFVLTTPNLARFADRLRFLFGKAPRHTTPIHDHLFLHIRPFTSDSLQDSLRMMGFKMEQIESTFVSLDPFLKFKLRSRVLAKFFPSLGKILIAKARVLD